jgi:hypothetical protein
LQTRVSIEKNNSDRILFWFVAGSWLGTEMVKKDGFWVSFRGSANISNLKKTHISVCGVRKREEILCF